MNLVLSDVVNEKAPNLAGKEVIRMVVPGISNAISYTSTVVMLRLLPLFLTSALDNVLTNTLTKAITHTLSSSLTHTLKYSPDQESLCYNCRALNKDCDKCRVSWKAEETAEIPAEQQISPEAHGGDATDDMIGDIEADKGEEGRRRTSPR